MVWDILLCMIEVALLINDIDVDSNLFARCLVPDHVVRELVRELAGAIGVTNSMCSPARTVTRTSD